MNLYLTEQGIKVRREGRRLQLVKEKGPLREFRLDDLERIFVFGRVHFTAQAIHGILKHDVEVHFLTVSGRYLGRLTPPRGKNIELRLSQFRAFEDEKRRLDLAKAFVRGKIENQRAFLRRQNKKLKDEALARAILTLKGKLRDLEAAEDLDALRGVEGQAAHVYFEVFGRLFQVKGLHFPGRIKRPPPDPVNALLSLGYTLLVSLINGFAEASGLDPYLGYLHAPDYGRPSLVLDLMEEWRPVVVDPLVVRLFNWGAIRPEDFTEEPWDEDEDFSSCRLTPEGLRKFLDHYHRRLDEEVHYPPLDKKFALRDVVRHQVWHLCRVLKGQEPEYQPFLY
ncbi:MAG: CRISPR-associated endonuclease Cas1 [Thermodesulfobacteria bacterium]|nr:CRISPR-associated endonuclease Cas1 [Thermodesulfobacteriota bacterium]